MCRVLAARREGAVLSKAQGGKWGLAYLPQQWHAPVRTALSAYETGERCDCEAWLLQDFAAMMLKEIDG